MLNQVFFLLLTAITTFILYPFWINFVYKYHMGESIREDGPQSHMVKKGTPTMGGFVFIFTVSIITLLLNRSRNQTIFPIFVTLIAGLLGMIEDFAKVYKKSKLKINIFTSENKLFKLVFKPYVYFKEITRVLGSSEGTGLNSTVKLLFQFFLAGFVSYWTYFKLGWDYFWIPLYGDVHVGMLYPIIIFFLFLVIMNFVAITDGIDGLAGGLGIIAYGALWVIASQLGYNSLATLAATFVGAMLPFLYFNIHPARIFMGDVGSHVLGASLALFGIVMHREIAVLIILAVYLVDGFTSPLQQLSVKFTGKRIFRMAPFHHHFELLGWPEAKVTMRFWLFGILFGFLGIFVALL